MLDMCILPHLQQAGTWGKIKKKKMIWTELRITISVKSSVSALLLVKATAAAHSSSGRNHILLNLVWNKKSSSLKVRFCSALMQFSESQNFFCCSAELIIHTDCRVDRLTVRPQSGIPYLYSTLCLLPLNVLFNRLLNHPIRVWVQHRQKKKNMKATHISNKNAKSSKAR